jgi:hypothetical protein
MKELAFLIAQKIANDNSKETVLVCGSILKDAFILQGATKKQANIMAIDTLKIIMKSMVNLGSKLNANAN